MKSNHIEQLAEWHACATFIGGMDSWTGIFDYKKVLEDLEEDGTLPEGWSIWSPFENHEDSDLVSLIETQKDVFLGFYGEIVENGTYFAGDGNYGEAKGLAIVNTERWTEKDFQEIEEDSDWNAPSNALAIAKRYDEKNS